MMFVVYFVVSESLSIKKEGRAYFTLWANYGQWVFILLTTCTVVVHLSQATLADQQWLKYLNNRKGFTNFYQVAFLNTVFSTLAASLLFLLTVQVRRGLGGSSTWAGMCALVLLGQLVTRAPSHGRGSKGPRSEKNCEAVVLLCQMLPQPGSAAGQRWWVVVPWASLLQHLGSLKPLGPQYPWGVQPSLADGRISSARSPLTRMSPALPEFAFLRLVEMFERPFPGLDGPGSSLRDGPVL